MKNNSVYQLTMSALLMAVAIVIPIISPVKIPLGAGSFTLASHAAIMIAMFISLKTAISVELGATLGFFLAGFPAVVVARAASQIVFVIIGAYLLKKKPEIMKHWVTMLAFCLGIACIHAICEVIVCLPFYTTLSFTDMIYPLFVLVGGVTFVHSCVDFILAVFVWKALLGVKAIAKIANVKTLPF